MKSSSAKELAEMRALLATYEAEVAGINEEVDALSRQRDQLAAARLVAGTDVVRQWKLDEDIEVLEGQIRVLLDKKAKPAERVAGLRAHLSPIEEREREATHRAAAAAGCDELLRAYSMLEACRPFIAEARRLYALSAGHLGFEATANKLEGVINSWREVTVPQLRQSQADHRRFVQSSGIQ